MRCFAVCEWLQEQADGELRGILDASKYAYAGHSMGGGGTLIAGALFLCANAVRFSTFTR